MRRDAGRKVSLGPAPARFPLAVRSERGGAVLACQVEPWPIARSLKWPSSWATPSGSPPDRYVYALTDYYEVDRTIALARVGA
jgi:hypothetical protein